MKLRYQLRGLGIGIMVTALLMGVATGKGIPLSDAEIRAKALELGMVERDSLKLTDVADVPPASAALPESGEIRDTEAADDGSKTDEQGADHQTGASAASGADGGLETGASAGTDAPGQEISTDTDGDPEDASGVMGSEGASADGEEGTDLPSGTGQGSGTADGAVRIVIEYGVTSDHVSEMLAEAGLVADAAAFDTYLCDNGLSRSITAGIYEIEPGTSEEEIIRLITKNR